MTLPTKGNLTLFWKEAALREQATTSLLHLRVLANQDHRAATVSDASAAFDCGCFSSAWFVIQL